MTIVLGIKTPQAVILSADTQETLEGSHKVNHPKLIYHTTPSNICSLPIGMAVAGAGFGPWIDKLTTLMWEAIQDATNLDEACDKVETEIKDRYREYRDLYSDLNTELIYGIGASSSTKLFHAYGPIVNEINRRASGSGQAIADFLMRHFSEATHITNAMAWVVYVLYCAKQHADGCGGDTHIAIIQNDGTNYKLDAEQIKTMEDIFEKSSQLTDMLLMAAANPLFDEESIREAAKAIANGIAAETRKLSAVSSIPELLEKLRYKPKQSDAQT